MQAKQVAELDLAQQNIAALLDTSASVLAAAASGDRIQVLANADTFMTTAQNVHTTLRAAVARHTQPQPFSRTASLAETEAEVAEAAARDART